MASVLLRILAFVCPHAVLLTGVYGYLVLALLCELAGPAILGGALDVLLAAGSGGESAAAEALDGVLVCGAAYLVVGLAGQILNLRKEVLRTRLSTRVLCDVRVQLYAAIQRLSFRYHGANHSGDLITRATRDVYAVHTLYSETIFVGAEILILAGGAAVLIALADWRLALLAFSTFPIAIAVIAGTAGRMRRLLRDASDQYDAVTRVVQESVSGVRVVKAFGREPAEVGKFERETAGFLDRTLGAIRYFTLNLPLAGMLFNLSIPITLAGGAALVWSGGAGVGEVAAAIFYLAKVSNVLRLLNRAVQTLEDAASGGDRLLAILDAEPDVKEAPVPWRLPPGKGEVVFDQVCFEHQPGKPVLRGVSLRLAPGKRTAIVGPTGSGKTILASLIPRFYDPSAGRVLLDGADVRGLSLADLRRAVSVIFQDTFLFSMTIAENIAYGRPDASRDDIERCARAAQIHDFIAGLERGYDTVIGERGMSLSGGQKQRVAIARALLMDPRVLILDDATASVDAETERKLEAAMTSLAAGRTAIVIAQRLSTVLEADRIVFIDEGRVVAEGAHPELLADCEGYAAIFAAQAAPALQLPVEAAA